MLSTLDVVRPRLDEVERMSVGTGHLDFGLRGRGSLSTGFLGLGLDAQYRATENLSLFGDAELGYQYGDNRSLQWQAIAGLRLRLRF